VAIKKVPIREDNILEVKRLVREAYLLKHFNHENLVGLKDVLEVYEANQFEDLYLVTDLMDTDLHQIIRSKQILSAEHVQFFLYQIFRGLKAMHSAQVLHRDLKPSNIVVNSNCDLKICDFGLAREQDTEMTDYVATRWYRAPELLLQWKGYSGAVDCWSVGCIFSELLLRKPILPGRNYLDQLHIILDLVGSPREEDVQGIGSEKARQYITRLRPRRCRKDLRQVFPMATDSCIGLLSQLLQFNPSDRPTAVEALAHPYFSSLHDIADEPEAEVFAFDLDIRSSHVTVTELKAALFRLLLEFHPECSAVPWRAPEDQRLAMDRLAERISLLDLV
jgi:serine/threonine protein kinase